MMGLSRYRLSVLVGYEPRAEVHPEGEWVMYADVDALTNALSVHETHAFLRTAELDAAESRVRELEECLYNPDVDGPAAPECPYTASSFCGDTGCKTHGYGDQPAAPTRAEAEQAVLDAMRDVAESTLRNYAHDPDPFFAESQWRAPARAELARRGLKP